MTSQKTWGEIGCYTTGCFPTWKGKGLIVQLSRPKSHMERPREWGGTKTVEIRGELCCALMFYI